MTDNKTQIENAARNARIEKELAAALSNRNKKNESKTKGRKKKKTKVDNSIFVFTDEEKFADSLTGQDALSVRKVSKKSKAKDASKVSSSTKASKAEKTTNKQSAPAPSGKTKAKKLDEAPVFRIKNVPANLKPLYVRGSEVITVSNTLPSTSCKSAKKVRGPKEPLNLNSLSDVTFVDDKTVVLATPFVVTCSICGSTKDVGYFKNANICLKCLSMIKKKM